MDAVRTEAVKLWKKMGRLMDSGIPILQVFDICRDECSIKELADIILGIRDDIKSGGSMASSIAKYPAYFSQSVVTMVQAGEVTGELSRTCEKIAEGLDDGTFEMSGTSTEISDASDRPAPPKEENAVIKTVGSIIANAITSRATDIHWEWVNGNMRVRCRIDGAMQEVEDASITPQNQEGIISRIKIMANVNVGEKRLPQDGRIQVNVKGDSYDIRVSFVPYHDGESAVMRIINKNFALPGLDQQGLTDANLKTLESWCGRPAGIILVNGPTGCGKTTTLYSILKQINRPEVKVVTIEDPVELTIPGVNQLPVKTAIGLTFGAGLRSMLRQDPDIIMVGEIRDLETAKICMQAALTGHLVLTTLHAQDGAGAVMRLVDIGVEPFLVNSALIGVVSQRLVRQVCRKCKEESEPPAWIKNANGGLEQDTYFKGKGCESCNGSGYRGRMAIHELLGLDDKLRDVIMRKPGMQELREHVKAAGTISMREDGLAKAAEGLTTVEEVLRVGV